MRSSNILEVPGLY